MLNLHRSERADALLAALAGQMWTPIADVMVPEVVCVPSRGIERWITQGLATQLGVSGLGADGVAANIQWPTPAALVRDVVSMASGIEPSQDPWSNGQLLWALADVIDANLDSEWLKLVADQIRSGAIATATTTRTDRMGTFQYVADIFGRYHWQRPQMILQWVAGNDVDHSGAALSVDDLWQPQLWRAVRERLSVASPPERLASAVERVAAGEVELPFAERIHVFGLTQILPAHVQVLAALARRDDVHIYLLHPSHQLWQQVAATGQVPANLLRADDCSVAAVSNPLLASWARDSRELQLVTSNLAIDADHYYEYPVFPETLLGRIQRDVVGNAMPAAALDPGCALPVVDPASDRSLQVHACHGAARQVQVMRDAILQAFDDDPTLEPRDVVIMCPDVETFAPYIKAVFDQIPDLRVRLADRSTATTNPLVAATVGMLDLAVSRCSGSEIIAFLHNEAVRAKFDFSDDDLDRIFGWVKSAGISWGLSAAHRQTWGLSGLGKDTWHEGLDRLILGVAMADDELRTVGRTVPVDDVTSTDIEVVGRLLRCVQAIEAMVERFTGNFTIDEIIARIGQSVDELMTVAAGESWQRVELHRVLQATRAVPASIRESAGLSTPISLNEYRDLLDAELAGRPTRSNFRTGNVTVCTLTPMRSVPHRIVCLLGIDDGSFPRAGRASRDDLTSRAPLVGDHDPRGEDRQLFMDALLAATDRLIITYAGRNERTNDVMPPAVPVSELLTVVDQTVQLKPYPDAAPVGSDDHPSLVIAHPLQAFDARNFTVDRLGLTGQSFSFDHDAFRGAEAAQQRADSIDGESLWQSSEPARIDAVSLDDLVEFISHPTKFYLRRVLNLQLTDHTDELNDELALALDGLGRWTIGDRLLSALIASDPDDEQEVLDHWLVSESVRGGFPAGELANSDLEQQSEIARSIAAQVRAQRAGAATRTVSVHTTLPSGVLLYGNVSGVAGDKLVAHSFSKIRDEYTKAAKARIMGRAKYQLSLWIRLLALAAAHPDTDWQAVLVGQDKSFKRGGPAWQVGVVQMTLPNNAAEVLDKLVTLYRRGLTEPLPLIPETSQAFELAREHGYAERDVREVFVTKYIGPGSRSKEHEDCDEYLLAAFGPRTPEDLLGDQKFTYCAHLVWAPLLDHTEFGVAQ